MLTTKVADKDSEAIGRLTKEIYCHLGFFQEDTSFNEVATDIAQEVLTAIQADPLAYVKPKPLEWTYDALNCAFDHLKPTEEATVGKFWTAKTQVATYEINYYCDPRFLKINRDYKLIGGGFKDKPFPTLEAAQAAAYDDLCKRAKELF